MNEPVDLPWVPKVFEAANQGPEVLPGTGAFKF